MLRRIFGWIAVITICTALVVANVFAAEKGSDTSTGIPPQTVANYLRAVILAHRHFYTIDIVNRLRLEHIVDVSENWRAKHALPLPVQFLRETSEMAELTSPDVRYRLISQWPISKANAPATEFERQGLKQVQDNPNRPYYGFFENGTERSFGAVYADKAVTTSCIECHNAHPHSPKSDFKLDDVIGGLVITFPLNTK
ncbi:MAG TPA: DUF3365 domain-containing protein [Nitrospira sp.]|nr:DUF3365 domain-containing protein [Nitrospira sp.]